MTIVSGGRRRERRETGPSWAVPGIGGKGPLVTASGARLLLLPCLLLLLLWATTLPAAGRVSDAEQYLREKKGLVPLERSQTWVTPLETRMRRRLLHMQMLEVRIRAAQRDLEERIAANRRLWPAQQARFVQLQQGLKGLSKGDPQRTRLEAELRLLKSQASPPDQLGGRGEVQEELIGLINDRNSLTASLFWIRHSADRLRDEYRELAGDSQVRSRLEQLGANHQLGPEKDYPKQVRKYEPLVLTDWVPLYRKSNRLRFCLLAEDRVPLTFSWRDDSGPTLVTLSMLERMGLELPPDADRVEQQVGKRRLLTTRMTLPSLRAGRWVFEDVEAYVLPAEAEDVGALLGRAACGKMEVRVEPEKLRIVWNTQD